MALTILTNIASLRAQTQLGKASDALSSTEERLASGLRINHASDDAAGLAVSAILQSQSRIATVAIRNTNDGISALSVAEGALESIGNVLVQMSELAEQSANGTLQNTQRSAIQLEFAALGSEIERIASTATFNNIHLLSGSSSIAIQVGFDSSSTSQIIINAVQATLSSIKLANSGSSQLGYSVIGNTIADSQQAALTALAAVTDAINTVSAQRGSIGASESRLNHSLQNLQTTRLNYLEANSRITDVDVAEATAQLVREQILQQVSVAVLAQANLQPNLVLKLLQN